MASLVSTMNTSPLFSPPSSPYFDSQNRRERIVDKKSEFGYSRNELLQCKPSSAKIPFLSLEPQTVVIKVKNCSNKHLRTNVGPPMSPYFKASLNKQVSFVPGMSDLLTITFAPDSFRYYYDCIRVTCEDDSVTIPIHAYPVLNTNTISNAPGCLLPRIIEFGGCNVGVPQYKTYVFENKVPIQFEFEINLVDPHPFFTIEPMKGVIEGSSEWSVTVIFNPLELCTCSTKISLNLQQYGFVPYTTTITGYSTPGTVAPIFSSPVKFPPLIKKGLEITDLESLDSTIVSKAKTQAINQVSKVIAQEARENQKKVEKLEKSETREINRDEDTQTMKQIEGIMVATSKLNTHSAISSILMQQPGKSKIRNLKQMKTEENSETTMRQIKELQFEHEVRQNIEFEKSKELKWFVCLGEPPMNAKEKEIILQERERSKDKHILSPNPIIIPSSTETTSPVIVNSLLNDPDYSRSSVSSSQPRRVVILANNTPTHNPTFSTYINDVWAKRKLALDRFTKAARVIITRIRVEKRLQLIHSFLSRCGYDKAKIAEEGPKLTNRINLSKSDQNSFSSETSSIQFYPGKIVVENFPVYKHSTAPERTPVPNPNLKEIVQNFEELPTFELKERLEYQLMEYKPYTPPSFVSPYSYTPRVASSRMLRSGAEDDVVTRPQKLIDNSTTNTSANTTNTSNNNTNTNTNNINNMNLTPPSSCFSNVLPSTAISLVLPHYKGVTNVNDPSLLLKTSFVFSQPSKLTEADITYPLSPYVRTDENFPSLISLKPTEENTTTKSNQNTTTNSVIYNPTLSHSLGFIHHSLIPPVTPNTHTPYAPKTNTNSHSKTPPHIPTPVDLEKILSEDIDEEEEVRITFDMVRTKFFIPPSNTTRNNNNSTNSTITNIASQVFTQPTEEQRRIAWSSENQLENFVDLQQEGIKEMSRLITDPSLRLYIQP
eukprot:TRINITY_DN3803_c0_g2_i5.p1 TRINITY_DN3803_c0_g2~~TRINITY_DN3803_c0_g2_i5.p1  ORF type:complete len:943 (-),score=239.44 TRINITY_DN3803_c0_g2_i5:77-2905(-)